MIQLTLSEIAAAVDGELIGQDSLVVGSVETDSRLVTDGALFVAKPGEATDGHFFVADSFAAGAVGALVERRLDIDASQILVKDSVLALGKLASFVIAKLHDTGRLKVIAVTGSNGKTSTKNMLRKVLEKFGNTIAPIESYNNEVGAPISMLKANYETDYLVAELGAGGPGSIRYLAEMCRPDVGVVLKVGLAHVGEFGGIEKTFEIKSELVRELSENAQLVLNSDDSLVSEMANLTQARKIWFGTNSEANVRASNLGLTLEGTHFELSIYGEPRGTVALKILGEHQVMNALATLAVVKALNLNVETAISALQELELAERWRMQLLSGPNGSTVINDAYNASPDSMRAALQTLATLGRQGHSTIAVLGEMAELGAEAASQHDEIGRLVVRLNIDQLFVVGQRAKLIHLGALQEGSWDGESKFFESIDEALEQVRGLLGSGDIVLVKSSKSANLRFLGDALAEVK
ncbi:MAG: UDP-N-acetylmuramoyl-tripeptide--D-alanyl-D-alanine ligase [Micrococcales bacterium]